jgi:hypothetical protein
LHLVGVPAVSEAVQVVVSVEGQAAVSGARQGAAVSVGEEAVASAEAEGNKPRWSTFARFSARISPLAG